ncbi:MAG: GNAT family N-acetyltransferase, partial [Flavobacteriales bacterium]
GWQEPELWTYGLEAPTTEGSMRAYILRALEQRSQGHGLPLVIIDQATGQVAGCTRYYHIQPAHRRVSIGYTWLGRAFQGTGINQAVKQLMLDYVFQTCRWERVEFMADVENKKSISAILKLGAQTEGVLRSHAIKPDGARRDTAVFSLLRSDWLEIINS